MFALASLDFDASRLSREGQYRFRLTFIFLLQKTEYASGAITSSQLHWFNKFRKQRMDFSAQF